MNEPGDFEDIDSFEREMIAEALASLRDASKRLRQTHAQRAAAPLIFVETYEDVRNEIGHFAVAGHGAVVKNEIRNLKRLLGQFGAEYRSLRGVSKALRTRNTAWGKLNEHPRIIGGGKADGNR